MYMTNPAARLDGGQPPRWEAIPGSRRARTPRPLTHVSVRCEAAAENVGMGRASGMCMEQEARGSLNMAANRYVLTFEEGNPADKMLLGGKGANLCAMTQIGLDVPPGFVISTAACLAYLDRNALPDDLMADVRAHVTTLERKTGKRFGDPANPLLVSVRSGSAMSMPGMMDTILNLGLNEATLAGTDPHHRQSAVRLRRVAAVRPAVRQDRARRPRRGVRRSDDGRQARAWREE